MVQIPTMGKVDCQISCCTFSAQFPKGYSENSNYGPFKTDHHTMYQKCFLTPQMCNKSAPPPLAGYKSSLEKIISTMLFESLDS